MSNYRVANVQLVDATNRGDRFGVVVVQTMASIDDQPMAQAGLHTVANAGKLAGPLGHAMRIGITAGVQLDRRRAHTSSRFNLTRIGVNE